MLAFKQLNEAHKQHELARENISQQLGRTLTDKIDMVGFKAELDAYYEGRFTAMVMIYCATLGIDNGLPDRIEIAARRHANKSCDETRREYLIELKTLRDYLRINEDMS